MEVRTSFQPGIKITNNYEISDVLLKMRLFKTLTLIQVSLDQISANSQLKLEKLGNDWISIFIQL